MTGIQELYRPWQINGTFLNRMLHCGGRSNSWLQAVLTDFFPADLFDIWKDKIAFVSTASNDAFRIAIKTRLERELIFVSEHIIPPPGAALDHPDVRYFIFVALHELVHVIKQHKPPNEILEEANKIQEEEADRFAFEWFNGYVKRMKNPYLTEFTVQELNEAKARNAEKLQALQ